MCGYANISAAVMKQFLPILFLLFACSTNSGKTENKISQADSTLVTETRKKDLSDPTNTLTGKTETLQLYYIDWFCACANWVTPEDLKKGLDKHTIFIEPARPELEVPLYFDASRHMVKVTGQFYQKPDYPKGTEETEEHLDKAKVFRYTKMEVFKKDNDYSSKDDITLNLAYNAIGCPCAQWSEVKSESDTTKEYYYLEPANNKLINADNLWNGEDLPLQIQVTGQIVSHAGYPTGYNPAKGNPEPSTVFRYTKIKVLKNGSRKRPVTLH
jgi:hypothetical protein